MDKRRLTAIIILLIFCIAATIGFANWQNNRHAKIDEWSGAVREEGFDWAEAASGYGVEKISYTFSQEDYTALTELLHGVTEDNSTRKRPDDAEQIDCRLSLSYEGKLWLFHCQSNGMVSITFEDPETGAYYGCEGSLLYVNVPKLHQFILDTVDTKAG